MLQVKGAVSHFTHICCRAPARQHTILDVTRSSCFFVSSSPAELYLVEISIFAVEMSAIPGEN